MTVQTESRYDIDPRSKVLAEISLWEAYNNAPKFKMFAWATILLGTYDYLHSFNPVFYGMTFIALATFNGFSYSLDHSQTVHLPEPGYPSIAVLRRISPRIRHFSWPLDRA